MPVSAIVLTLTREEPRRGEALRRLGTLEHVRCGEPDGAFLPAVLETPTARSSAELCAELLGVPGIEYLSVVSVDFRGGAPESAGSAARGEDEDLHGAA